MCKDIRLLAVVWNLCAFYGRETIVVSLHHRLFILCTLKQNFLWLKCKKCPGNVIATYLQLLEKHSLDSLGDTEKKQREGILFPPNYITSHNFLLIFFSV